MESRGIAGTRVSLRDSFFPILGWFIPSRSFPARFPTDSMRSRVISVSFPCHSVGVLFFCRLDQFLLTLIANLFARWNETVDAPPCKNMNCRRPSVLISIAPVVLLLSIGRPKWHVAITIALGMGAGGGGGGGEEGNRLFESL